MKLVKTLSVIASIFALSACAQQMRSEKDSAMEAKEPVIKQVVYACGAKANKIVKVTYNFEGEKAVSAKVAYKGRAVSKNDFNRVEDKDSARFVSPEKLVWIADENLTLSNFDQVDGNMLYKEGKKTDKILVKYCKLNQKATAKLNK